MRARMLETCPSVRDSGSPPEPRKSPKPGVARMVEEHRYCIDVITQIQAIKAALAKVEEAILTDHIDTCVEHALVGDDIEERRAKVNELLKVLPRMGKGG